MQAGIEIFNDYKWATIHIAVANRKTNGINYLQNIFTMIEMLPSEFPKPNFTNEKVSKIKLSEGWTFICRFIISAQEGINWYNNAHTGTLVIPKTKKPIKSESLAAEPDWPNTVCLDANQGFYPFIPKWISSPRISSLYPDVEPSFQENDKIKAFQWIERYLNFNAKIHTHFLGSIHLILPNPRLREVHLQKKPPSGPLSISVIPRFKTRELKGLKIFIEELRLEGLGFSVTDKLKMSHNWVLPSVGSFALKIIDKKRGVIHWQSYSPFISAIYLSSHIKTGEKKVTTQKEETYSVSCHLPPVTTKIGIPALNPLGKLVEIHSRNRSNSEHLASYQKIIDNKNDAKDYIRKIINKANFRIWIVDCYFCADDIESFALASSGSHVEILIITSAKVLDQKDPCNESKTQAVKLQETLSLIPKSFRNAIKIMVMPGSSPRFHDRFLCIDDEVWSLGGSLNNIGKRISIMVKTPNPKEILLRIHSELEGMVNFSTWAQETNKNSSP